MTIHRGSLEHQRPPLCPTGPARGATGLALCSVSCFGIGTSVSLPPTSHLEFLLAPPPASRAGTSCLVRFRLRRGLGSSRLLSVGARFDPSDHPSLSFPGRALSTWPSGRVAPQSGSPLSSVTWPPPLLSGLELGLVSVHPGQGPIFFPGLGAKGEDSFFLFLKKNYMYVHRRV